MNTMEKMHNARDTECFFRLPVAVQAGLRVRMLALRSNRSDSCTFRSRGAPADTNSQPDATIPVKNAGQV